MKVPRPVIGIAFYGFEVIHFLQLLDSSRSVTFRGVQKCSFKEKKIMIKKKQIFVGGINQIPSKLLSKSTSGHTVIWPEWLYISRRTGQNLDKDSLYIHTIQKGVISQHHGQVKNNSGLRERWIIHLMHIDVPDIYEIVWGAPGLPYIFPIHLVGCHKHWFICLSDA